MLYDDTGRPLPIIYAARLATHVGYGPVANAPSSTTHFYWPGKPAGKAPYLPEVRANNVDFSYFSPVSTFTIYLMDATPGAITCHMLGEKIPDDDLFAMIEVWRNLPYST